MNNICRNKILFAILFVVLFLSFDALASDVYWKGGYTTNGAGFYYESSWDAGYPTPEDDVVIDETYITTKGNGNLVDGFWSEDTTWNSLTLNYDTVYSKPKKLNSNVGGPISITILNDVVKTGAGTAQFAMGVANTVFNLNVGGNIIVGKDKDTNGGVLDLGSSNSNTTADWGGPLDTLTVGKDIIVYNSSTLNMNVYNRKGTSSYSDPDVLIRGLIQGVGSESPNYINPTFHLLNVNPAELTSDVRSIISVEGFSGNGVVNVADYSTSEYAINSVIYLRSEKGLSYTFEGWTSDAGKNFNSNIKLKIVKDGIGTQIFSGTQLKFSGGVEVLGGTLIFNGIEEGRDTSHGDLTMRGGKLSYMVKDAANTGKSYMTFENLVYSDGTISLQVAPDSVDKVLLTGTLVAADVSNKGVVKIELVGGDLSYFESDYRLLIGMGTASSDYDDGDFMITNLDKSKYSANFDLRDDGLYLKLDVIPEPAAVCSIFGVVALALAAHGRRKK